MNLLSLIYIALCLLKCCLTQSSQPDCDVEWQRRGDNCYRLFPRKSVWSEAKHACEDEDATLLVIQNSVTAQNIQKLLNQLGKVTWIGLRNEKMADPISDWKWVTGEDLKDQNFIAWSYGEPQNTSDNSDICAYTKQYSISERGWYSKSCEETSPFICQKTLGSCSRGWFHVGDTCYYLGAEAVSWKYASDRCRIRNAQLVMIKSDRAQQNIMKFISKQVKSAAVWIGLLRDPNTKEIRWTDNTTVDYNNWKLREPDFNYDCAEIRISGSNQWAMEDCKYKQPFVCETPAVSSTPSPTTAPQATAWTTPFWDRRCPSAEWTFVPATGSCYMVNQGPEYWINAKSSCIQNNAALTSILNQAEQDAIMGLVSNDVAGYWIGLERGSPNKLRWIDDSPFAYFNFENNLSEADDVLGKLNAKGTWEFVDAEKRNGYICKKSPVEQGTTLSPTTTTPNPQRVNRSCPTGWFLIFDNCFQMINVPVTWGEGRETCWQEVGDLASIGSATEAMLLSFWASIKWGSGTVWIGLRSSKTGASGHQYSWSDGTRVTFTKWGSITSGSGTHNCASLNFQERTNDWSVSSCLDRRPILCKRPSMGAMNSSTAEPSTPFCPSGFSLSNLKCLTIDQTVGITRSEAANRCARLGGYLVTILSKDEQMAVKLELAHKGILGRRLWIGLTRVNNTWLWNETQAVQFDNWIDRDRNFTCASLITDNEIANYGQWTTDDCQSKDVGGFICEATNSIPTTTAGPTTPNNRRCELGPDWKEIGDRCFAFYAGTRLKTWIEARADCLQRGGDLASIMDEHTNRYLTQLPSRSYKEMWIGLNSRDQKDDYVWANIKDTVNYENWAVNPPDSHNEIERCAIYNTTDQKWSLLNCDVRRPYFCSAEKGATAPPTPTTTTGISTASPGCGGDRRYKHFNNYCYKVTTGQPTTWYNARDQCLAEGGDLASVLTDVEGKFLLSIIYGMRLDRAWTGFKSFGGATDYKWSDGNVPTYFNWARTRLTNTTGHHFCAYMTAADAFWYDLPCNQQLNFVCKRPSSDRTPAPQTIAPATPLPGNCPAEWRSAGDKCYRIFSGPDMQRDFSDASDYCRGFKLGVLASITSPTELATITAMMKNVNENVWIGYKLQSLQWVWLDHSQTQIANWNKGQMGSDTRLSCAKMLSASESISSVGRWVASNCTEKIGFACMALKSTGYMTAPTPSPTICPPGFVQLGSVCYMGSSSNTNWDDGKRICSSHGALLVSIYDTFEQNFVNSLIDPYKPDNGVWIGLSNLDDMSSYQWTDGYDMVFAKWNVSQPVSDVKKRCVFMRITGFWIVDDCNTNRPFICAIRTGSSLTSPPPNLGNCPPQWLTNGLYCYSIETGITIGRVYKFNEAEANCQLQGAELLSITSRSELDFIDTATEKLIGRNFVRNNAWVWIGMTIPEDGDFFWTDSSPVDFLNWESGERNSSKDENCVAFNLRSRKWVTLQCCVLGGYVCKKSRLGVDSATKLQTTRAETMSEITVSRELIVISDPPNIGFIDFLLKSKKNDGAIAGVSIVGIIILAAVAFAVVWYYRSKGSATVKPEAEVGFDNVYHYSTQRDQVEIKPAGAVNSS